MKELEKAVGEKEVVYCRPVDLHAPEMDRMRSEYRDYARTEEDVVLQEERISIMDDT